MVEESAIGIEILREIARIASGTLDLEETLQRTINVIKNRMRIDACSIYLMDHEGKEPRLKLHGSSGLPEDSAKKIYLKVGIGITGWVAEHKTTLALRDALQDPRFAYFPEIKEEKFQSMLSVPLQDQGECIGVINVQTEEKRQFSLMEISLLETISGQITGFIRNAVAYQKSQSFLREQTLLNEIGLAIQGTPKLDDRLWILLTGITHGLAGGFNRVILFLVDEKDRVLKGYMGLGPKSGEEAEKIWTELAQKSTTPQPWILKFPDFENYKTSSFNQFAKNLSFPIEGNPPNAITETVIQKRPIHVRDSSNDPLVSAELAKDLGSLEFATVPLMPHQEVLGVLLVDNRFNQKPIDDSNVRLLTRLATHVGWVLENSRLFTKLLESNRELLTTKELLIQSEKLAALGEMSAEVAHEIKNPLVSIGGFARRLQDRLTQLSQSDGKNEMFREYAEYSNIIVKEAERLEKLLNDILFLSKTDQIQPEECHLRTLLEEVLKIFDIGIQERDIELQFQVHDNLPDLNLDRMKIKQVFINIFFNAIESMPSGGILTVQSLPTHMEDGREWIGVAVEDTGGGIAPETFENIFNPFFTTKESGTGLGLAISRKILESHGGSIQVKNNINKGVTVYVYLPLQKYPDYNKN